MGAEVYGLRELRAGLAASTVRVGARASSLIRKTTLDIERDAKINRSRGNNPTGFLLNSITSSFTGDGRTGSMRGEVGPTAYYGVFVELGTSRMGAQPYLFPALDRHEESFVNGMAQLATEDLD